VCFDLRLKKAGNKKFQKKNKKKRLTFSFVPFKYMNVVVG